MASRIRARLAFLKAIPGWQPAADCQTPPQSMADKLRSSFELFIANRYLRAHRKEAVISIITAISVLGVAAGVMALVVALAVTNGFHNTLQRNLLGAMAHINVEEREPLYGMENWGDLAASLQKRPHA